MRLLNLPEEIILIIIKMLDTKSLYNMYCTCPHIRNMICMQGIVKKCQLSLSTLATVHSLNLDFFKSICGHLLELNLSGVPDLTKSALISAIKRMKCLKTLDVSYTKIQITDLLRIYELCPTLKNISINFILELTTSPYKTLKKCLDMFKNFENIHFIGTPSNLLYCKVAIKILLANTSINKLKFTIIDQDSPTYSYSECENWIKFKQFEIALLNWKSPTKFFGYFDAFPVFKRLDLTKYEFFILSCPTIGNMTVFATPLLETFFNINFGAIMKVNAININRLRILLPERFVIRFWDKARTKFDDRFFSDLSQNIEHCIPYSYPLDRGTQVPVKFDWFYTVPINKEIILENPYEPRFKRRRTAPPYLVLDYDDAFRQKHDVKLSIHFDVHITSCVSLSTSSDYLGKLSFLSLCGTVRYSQDFFNLLFRCCHKLITLNVEAPSVSPCASAISRSIPLSRSIKNVRLVDKKIDFDTLFSSLSQCRMLENINIVDKVSINTELADPTLLFRQCNNIYNIFIYASMADTIWSKKVQMFNEAKRKCKKPHLRIELTSPNLPSYSYDPFINVFRVLPLNISG